MIIGGDINCRIGAENDFVENIDSLPLRSSIDMVKNSYCENFIDLLKDVKICLVHGRVTPELDNFTSLNNRGHSVVDYFII